MSEVVSVQSSKSKRGSCLKCLNLLITAFPSIVLGVFTIVFTVVQSDMAQKNREQDQREAEERNMRTTFDDYIKDVSSLLLDRKFNRSNREHLLHISVKTLTALRYVDAVRSRDIILFLYETRLLRTDVDPRQRLNLADANLSDVEFIASSSTKINLQHLNLAGVYAPNIVFTRCNLDRAIFDGATLSNAKFSYSTINNASFQRIYAPNLMLTNTTFYGNDFDDSKMPRLFLDQVTANGIVDLTNADLYDNITGPDYRTMKYLKDNPFVIIGNARLPDGTYGPIDSSNQVQDGDAERLVSFINSLIGFR